MNNNELIEALIDIHETLNRDQSVSTEMLHTTLVEAAARIRALSIERDDLEAALAEGQEVWAEARRVGPQHLDYTPIPRGQQMYEMEKRRRAFEKMQRAFAEDYDVTDE